MAPKMTDKTWDMVKHRLAHAELAERYSNFLHVIQSFVSYRFLDDDASRALTDAFHKIRTALSEKQLDAYRDAWAFGMSLGEERRKELLQLAYRKHYDECKSVSHLLTPDGNVPDIFSEKEIDAVRKWLKESMQCSSGTCP